MSLQTLFSSFRTRAGLSYNLALAIGAMLATLAVVVYADLATTIATERVHIILQGAQMILLTVASGLIAGAVHVFATAGDAAPRKFISQTGATA